MRVDLASLETFNRIGSDGAERAAASLSTLAGLETRVETTRINFVPTADLADVLDLSGVAVGIAFEGGLDGHALLVFDDDSATRVLESLAGESPDPDYLNEVANIMTSGFVDGWAEPLASTIDVSTPSTVSELPGRADYEAAGAFSFVFQSEIGIEEASSCRFYMLPEPASFVETLRETDGESAGAVEVDELATFIRLTAAGAETVAANLEAMTGIETDVAVSHLDFVPVEHLPGMVGADQQVGTVFGFSGAMDGYLAVLFDADGASAIAGALGGEDAMRQSAIEEIGNVTASGFVDGWANALEDTIDHTVPEFVDDMGQAVLQSIAAEIGLSREFAYVFDVTVDAAAPLSLRLFAIPEEDGVRSLVDRLDADLDIGDVERL